MTKSLKSVFRMNGHHSSCDKNDIYWALKDITFEVKEGEVVGLIGHNGAGKSTLLKILTRITSPTTGKIKLHGRVSSLLEVGTGFHPELTGRENIYLNGAILGMKKEEISRKFDEIVAFAEVERFLDTPVKRYSSGMGVRLAFAVAAHLEPEILLIDEVLAVGDSGFQRKCLGKMESVSKEGRTIIFVSHQMAAVSNLCNRAILLQDGQIKMMGDTESVVKRYLVNVGEQSDLPLHVRTDRVGSGRLRFSELRIEDFNGNATRTILSGEGIKLILKYNSCIENDDELQNVSVAALFLDRGGNKIFTVGSFISGGDFEKAPSCGSFVCEIPKFLLVEEEYHIHVWASVNGEEADYVENALTVNVASRNILGTSFTLLKRKHGTFVMPHSWMCHISL